MGLFSIFKGNRRVYFPGCITYFKYRGTFELYEKILSRLGIDFKLVNKKICCGLPAFELGYDSEARKIARRNFEIFKEEGVSEIITTDPGCYKFFLKDYPNLVPDWNIRVDNLWKLMADKLEAKPGLVKSRGIGKVIFQDSCYLGRYSGIYIEPRKILKLIGYEVVELPDSLESSICLGSCGSVTFTNPKLADEMAKEKILQVKRTGVKRVIVCSVGEYELLKKNILNNEIEVLEFSEVLALALGIKRREELFEENKTETSLSEESEESQADEEIREETELDDRKLQEIEGASDDEIDEIVENALKQQKEELVSKVASDLKKNTGQKQK